MADVLLGCCLPTVAAAASAEAAAGMPGSRVLLEKMQRLVSTLLHPSLRTALEQRLQGPGALAATQAALQAVEALPLPRPASMSAAEFGELYRFALALLNTCSAHMPEQASA